MLPTPTAAASTTTSSPATARSSSASTARRRVTSSPELVAAAAEVGVRVASYARPGYAGSTRLPGRTVADCVGDVLTLADALGAERAARLGNAVLAPGGQTGMHVLSGVTDHPHAPELARS